MNTIELIRKKRDGKELSKGEISYLIKDYTAGKIPDYQFSAFLMATFLNSLNKKETSHLTEAMLNSGKVVNLSSIKGIKVDKHSTGGVGDKTSLIIAPIVAVAGIYVPMISGRGLGHTGGTLDKLESIPGFKTNLNLTDYKKVLKKCNAVLIGQTKEIAPADKLIYALRDVTATVESIPLITASIMSKKLAEGIDGLVLDVKTGNGAFMKDVTKAEELAKSLLETAKTFDKKVIAFITDMNQPLGNNIGNWLEVLECIEIMRDGKKNDLAELSVILAGAMIYLGGKEKSLDEGIETAITILKSGKAFEKFVSIVKAQGGKEKILLNPETYPHSKFVKEVKAENSGYLTNINTYNIGMIALELGAGRKRKEDLIDHKAGVIFKFKLGDYISKGDVILELHSNSKNKMANALKLISGSLKFSKNKVSKPSLVKKIII